MVMVMLRRARRGWHDERRHAVLRHGAVILSFLLGGCVRSNFNLATKQEEYTITPPEKEVDPGQKPPRHVEQELPVIADESLQQKVKLIGERIVAACDRQELVYS